MIYIGFGYDSKSWVSRAIAWFCKGKISHAFFLLDNPIFEWEVLGSEARGFYPMTASAWSPSYVVDLYAIPGLERALRKNARFLGAPYDFPGLIGMTWVMAFKHWFHRRVKNPFTKKGSWFCSAIVDQVLADAGLSHPADPRAVDPVTLRDFLAEAGYVRADYARVVAS
mgnify:CR=1 FL=1